MVWTYHSLFIHSPNEGHLGCFHVWAIMNQDAINICIGFCMDIKFSVHLGKHQEAQLLDDIYGFVLKKLPNCLPKVAVPFFPPTSNE